MAAHTGNSLERSPSRKLDELPHFIIEAISLLEENSQLFQLCSEYGIRAEGWLKAEMVRLLDRLKRERQIERFFVEHRDEEFKTQKNCPRLDLVVFAGKKKYAVELKVCCFDPGKRKKRGPALYAGQVEKDLRKLERLEKSERIFFSVWYPVPSDATWQRIASRLSDLGVGPCRMKADCSTHRIAVWNN